jgi:hypothetical protein
MPIRLLSGITATNSPPSDVTHGFPLRGASPGIDGSYWRGQDEGLIVVRSTAGSGTMTVEIRIWGLVSFEIDGSKVEFWVPHGSASTDADRGVLNQGNAIGEQASSADVLRHAEIIAGLSAYRRIAAEVVAIGGTGTAVDCFLLELGEG